MAAGSLAGGQARRSLMKVVEEEELVRHSWRKALEAVGNSAGGQGRGRRSRTMAVGVAAGSSAGVLDAGLGRRSSARAGSNSAPECRSWSMAAGV